MKIMSILLVFIITNLAQNFFVVRIPLQGSKDGLSARKLFELDGLDEWSNHVVGNGVSLQKTADGPMTPTVAPCGHEAPRRRRESVIGVGDASAFAITFPCKLTPPRHRCALAACSQDA